MNKLVSIITPCYNGEQFVHRFLNSILAQTYNNIELVFVNDGSTDNTEEIVLSFRDKFEKRGIPLIYIIQDNLGQAEAINNGLGKISGTYFCWPDSDDYLEDESISKRVLILEQYPEYAIVTSGVYVRNIEDLNNPIKILSDNNSKKSLYEQFDLLLKGESLIYSGCHMMRVDSFMDTHLNGKIFPSRGGQNWQILLPVYYKYKRFVLKEPLYNYIIYPISHSQGNTSEEKKLYRSREHEEILTNTISSMVMDSNEKEKYISLIRERYVRKNLSIAFEFKNKELFNKQYQFLKDRNELTQKDHFLMLSFKLNFNEFLYHVIEKYRKVKFLWSK